MNKIPYVNGQLKQFSYFTNTVEEITAIIKAE